MWKEGIAAKIVSPFLFVVTTEVSFLKKQYSVCRYFTFKIFYQLQSFLNRLNSLNIIGNKRPFFSLESKLELELELILQTSLFPVP